MNRKQVPVEELRLGMYVAELDRPWLGTPFPFQGFPVTSEEQIDELKKHCKTVVIDLDKGLWDDQHDPSRGRWSLRGPTVYPQLTSVEQELDAAKEVYSALEESIQELP